MDAGSLDELYKSIYAVRADYCLAISHGIRNQFIAMGANKEKVFTIYNPVNRSVDTILRPATAAVYIYVGRLDSNKNVSKLLNTLSRVTGNYLLHIIGAGCDEQVLKSLAARLEIHVVWHGWQSDPWHYIKTSIGAVSALVMTSKSEGFSMVLTEAISRGICCISSDCPAGPKEVINKDNGELYVLYDVEMLSSKLQMVIDGKVLPEQQTIKNSISHLYAEHYLDRLFAILQLHCCLLFCNCTNAGSAGVQPGEWC